MLIKAHKRWDTIAAKDRPESYVRRMVVNEYVSWMRKWARIIPSATLPGIDDQRSVPDPAINVADRDDLADRLRRLPVRQRTVIVLRYYEGLLDADVADTLGCSAGTVRGYALRALAALRIAMSPVSLTQLAVARGRESR